ncbi:tape measure domain-containing protein [Kerstersia gyiorum]|uniref:Tape measure domain-containing protein n=1 Tax=Kerstersia gyiorum TaxID=206506 RepID=A0A4Q7MVU8_9BURK|nr:tape measure protein [Kerstersia gyiorum]KAB0544161.1 tape measure protein [Kerstersia gyiorum]RZS73141.1 tape measure domain-containing protein [Kerstersia gyiorum]
MTDGNVGTIWYTVEAHTQKLLDSIKPADDSMGRLQKTFDRTDKAANDATFTLTKTAAAVKGLGAEANGASSSLGSLGKVLGGLLTIQGVRTLIDLSESYGEMSERVRMATASAEEYDMVQQRLLANANNTYRSLAESSEVYIRTADSLRAMGYSTETAMDAVDSLSYLFVTNATSAQRADSAISAFTKSLNKGKVEADGWETIMAAVPSVVNDIAASSGKTAEEIRRMGTAGELTARMLSDGLVTSLEKNRDAAASMATNLRDAFRSFTNNLSVFLGEANNASGATGMLSAAIIKLGENIDVIVKTLTAAGAGAMAAYITKSIQMALVNGRAAAEALKKAQAAAIAAKATAAASVAATSNATANTAEATAMDRTTAATTRQAAAMAALESAKNRVTRAGAGLLAALGGPAGLIGVVATVAAGWLVFKTNADDARKSMEAFDVPLDQAIEKFEKLSKIQQDKKMNDALSEQARTAKEAEAAWKRLYSAVRNINEFSTDWSRKQWSDWRVELLNARNAGEDLSPVLQKLYQAGVSREQIVHLVDLASKLDIAKTEAADATGLVAAFEATLRRVADAANNAAGALANAGAAAQAIGVEAQKQIDALEKQIALHEKAGTAASLLYDVEQARLHQKGQFAELNAKELDEIERLAQIRQKQEAATKKAAKTETEAQRKAKQAAEELKRAQESNIQTIDRMAQSLQFAALSGEALAKAQAAASLNSVATPEQVAQIEAMAAALYKVQQAEEARKKVGSTAQEVEQYVFGDVQPLSGGAFDDQTERYDAEAKAEQARYEEQLKRLQEAKALEIQQRQAYDTMIEELQAAHLERMSAMALEKEQAKTESDAQKLEADIALEQTQYEDELARLQEHLEKKYGLQVDYGELENKLAEENAARKAQIEKAKQNAQIRSLESGLGTMTDGLRAALGEQSAAYKAAAIAQTIIQTYQAAQGAYTSLVGIPVVGPALATAAAAAAVAGGMARVSSIRSSGGRQYGGPVSPGNGYRINENGAPEILNTASGRQYLLPNSRGEVVSNKDASGEGGKPVNISVVIQNAPPGTSASLNQVADEDFVLNVMIKDASQNGRYAQYGEANLGWRRRGY